MLSSSSSSSSWLLISSHSFDINMMSHNMPRTTVTAQASTDSSLLDPSSFQTRIWFQTVETLHASGWHPGFSTQRSEVNLNCLADKWWRMRGSSAAPLVVTLCVAASVQALLLWFLDDFSLDLCQKSCSW